MFVFNIDRGGTFTDFYVQKVQHQTIVPSQSSEGEGPIVGIKKFLQSLSLFDNNQSKIPTKLIKCINIGTTIATNALLERKGCKSLLIVSDGFDDLLSIRNQTRPNIFDLKCKRPEPLTNHVLTIDSRIYRNKIPTVNGQLEQIKQNAYYQKPSFERLEQLLTKIKQIGPQSIGISLCNSYLTSHAENKLAEYLTNNGIKNIQKGSNYIELGYLKRTQTASLDCYLNPIMKKYFQKLLESFQDQDLKIRIMKSDGGFTKKQSIMSSQLLLSGPAGGLIGYSRLSQDLDKLFGLKANFLVGLDMGGTSTDISKVRNNQIELKYSFEDQGLEICTPHLQIQTIAAGGGSKLGFENGMLSVGPQSVGANPGPVCYGVGDELAVTDANLLLNRLDVSFFPKVFGKDKNSAPNRELSMEAFKKLASQINKDCQNKKTIYQIAQGYIQIANQLMAKSARKILTLGRPDALVVFGSAGGQHCCNIGQKIGVNHIIVHKFSGILSAYGLSKAYQTKQRKIYIGIEINSQNFNFLQIKKLLLQKFDSSQQKIHQEADIVIEEVTIAYAGTSYSIKVPLNEQILKQFQKRHKQNNGFSLPNKIFKLEYYIKSFIRKPTSYQLKFEVTEPMDPSKFAFGTTSVFLNGKFEQLIKYKLNGMKNCKINGPALIFSQTSSILVQQNWNAHIVNQNIHLNRQKKQNLQQEAQNLSQIKQQQFSYKQCDPIKLTIYSTRLMGIAQQMGKVLQKTSISTNIKQRLDFSCGIFDWNGHLLANAPHLPVHLGSMETAVVQQIRRGIKPGDVILSNHPAAGGSHLPDLTVITCFQIVKGLNFYVASRGHHADIGSISPGSMPPFSRTLSQQGVAIQKFELVKNFQFLEKETRQLFKQSRRIDDNISDLLAQISANQIGIKLLKILISQYGVLEFKRYVFYVCQNAKQSVQQMLCRFSLNNNFPPVYSIYNTQYMDDGTPLCLKLTIDRQKRSAIFDFTGTGPEVIGNTNAPKSITRSAVLYCLRSLLGKDIPLNSGCLVPIKFIIPENSILYPSQNCAVVGGNVQTSQKLVDLILKPFNQVACSQGTMNNFLFGNQKLSYYETICGGSGAGNGFCGTTTQCHMTNTRITDVEHLERYYPVILTQFKKRANSGGQGKFRGGDGAIRQVMFLQEMEVSILSQRRIFSPYGLEGGQNGELGKNLLIKNNGIIKNIGSKNAFKVEKYDRVMINTPGGGGYGKY